MTIAKFPDKYMQVSFTKISIPAFVYSLMLECLIYETRHHNLKHTRRSYTQHLPSSPPTGKLEIENYHESGTMGP
jgi:hypothetical protein